MSSRYNIRRATPDDLESIIDFTLREASETEESEPDKEAVRIGVQSALEGVAPSRYWVAESDGGQIIASISIVTEWSNFRGGDYWWIQSLYIIQEHRGSGLVDALLERMIDEAKMENALELRLYVLNTNKRAYAAYRRSKFIEAPYRIMTRTLEN